MKRSWRVAGWSVLVLVTLLGYAGYRIALVDEWNARVRSAK